MNNALSHVEYDEELENEISLTQPQSDFFLSEKKFPLFVAGFGAGKSQTMCVSALNDLFNFAGANIAVYAPTYDLLRLIIMEYIETMLINGGFAYKLNNSSHTFSVYGFGDIICRSMDNPSRIVGYQTFRAHADELDTMDEKKARAAWNKIIARNRQSVYKLDENQRRIPKLTESGELVYKLGVRQFETHMNRVSAYTTPEGFKFAYKRWMKEEDKEGHYGVYRAPTYSNPHLPDDYIPTLRSSYPEELIDAYIEGEFVNLTSGAVYRKYDRNDNNSTEEVVGNEPIHVGMDFNVEHGAAVIHVMRDGDAHAVDEIFDSYDTDDTIRVLNERYPNNPINVYPDATGKKRTSSNGSPTKTDLAKLKKAGYRIHADNSNPLIKDRVNCVNAVILNGEGVIRYYVNQDKCPHTVDTLEQQVWDKNGMPDKATGLDHIGDALGYFVAKVFPIVRQAAGFISTYRRT